MNEELDLLKKAWKKDSHAYEQVTENQIYTMLHKKSSTTVKLIFIISLIELGFGLVLGILLSFTKYDAENVERIKEWGIYGYYIAVSIILYAVVLYFIYRFYTMYRKISVEDSVQKLIQNILKTRKVVKQYIAFNLTAFAVLCMLVFGFGFYKGYGEIAIANGQSPEIPMNVALLVMALIIIFTGIVTLLFWLFYKLIYGIFLKRLLKNYEELKKIDY